MLAFLHRREGAWVEKTDLGRAIDMKTHGRHWNSGLATLRRNGLAEIEGDRIRATADLYLDGDAR